MTRQWAGRYNRKETAGQSLVTRDSELVGGDSRPRGGTRVPRDRTVSLHVGDGTDSSGQVAT